MSVHVLEGQSATDHQHLRPVQQLGNFLGELLIALVFRSDPHFTGFLDDLFALSMHTGVEGGDSAGPSGE